VLTGAAPNATGVLSIARVAGMPAPFAGGGGLVAASPAQRLTTIELVAASATQEPGSGEWRLTLHVPASIAGETHAYRAVLVDPSAPGGFSATNRLYLTFGP